MAADMLQGYGLTRCANVSYMMQTLLDDTEFIATKGDRVYVVTYQPAVKSASYETFDSLPDQWQGSITLSVYPRTLQQLWSLHQQECEWPEPVAVDEESYHFDSKHELEASLTRHTLEGLCMLQTV